MRIATAIGQSMISSSIRSTLRLTAAVLFFSCPAVLAQTPAPPPPPDVPVAPARPPQIDLNLINLPTTMSIARHHGYFRLTHRFASDLTSRQLRRSGGRSVLDRQGRDYRPGVSVRNHQQHPGWRAPIDAQQDDSDLRTVGRASPGRLDAGGDIADAVGRRPEQHAREVSAGGGDYRIAHLRRPACAVRDAGVRGRHTCRGLHTGPRRTRSRRPASWRTNTAHHQDTWFAGFGGRLRFSGTGYITGEYTPRLHGYDPNSAEWGVAVEKRTGGHTLQLNFTNSFGTTFGQLARGGSPHDVYLGFNITRRF